MIRMPRGINSWRAAPIVILMMLAAAPALFAEPPDGKMVSQVIVQGNRKRTREEILSKMSTRVGQKYSTITANEDAGRLLADGWFLPNGVRIATQESIDGKLTVIVEVVELPNTIQDIIYRGALHLSESDLQKLTNLTRGAPMSPAMNMAGRQAILRKYQEMHRHCASVALVEGGKLDDTRVVYEISEGPSVKVKSIEIKFFGPNTSEISTQRMKTQLSSSRSYFNTLIGGDYNPIQLESDVNKLTEYFHNLGYLDTRISREVIDSADQRTVTIILHVQEGKRYKVNNVQIDGAKSSTPDQLMPYIDVRKGEDYDKFKVQADLDRLKKLKGYEGRFLNARETLHEAGDGVVNVHYQLDEPAREPIRVGEVKIIGNTVTRDNVIRRQVDLFPGQILSYPDLIEAERRLQRLGIFEDDPQTGIKPTVEIENPEVDSDFKNILVRVKEKPTGSFMIGAGVNSSAGLTGSVVVNERNFDVTRWPTSLDEILEGQAWRGAGQEFRIQAQPGTVMQSYTMSLREPYLFDSLYSGAISGYFFQRVYTEYAEERIGGRLTFARRLSPLWTATLNERVEDVQVYDTYAYEPTQITKYAGYSTVVGTKLGLTRDARDNVLRPSDGSIVDFSGEFVTGTYDYALATAEASRYFTTFQRKDGSGKQVLAFRTQANFASDNTPVFDRFYAGGMRSIRGFQFRGVGPFINGYNIGGDFALLNSIEYQIPVMASDSLYFVSFVDSGTVENSVEIKDYRVTAGVGVRISIPQLLGPVPLALDFGFPIVQGPEDRKQVFSFWLGFFN